MSEQESYRWIFALVTIFMLCFTGTIGGCVYKIYLIEKDCLAQKGLFINEHCYFGVK